MFSHSCRDTKRPTFTHSFLHRVKSVSMIENHTLLFYDEDKKKKTPIRRVILLFKGGITIMSNSVKTISFIHDLDTTCQKGIEFLHNMSNKYPEYTVKMLSNVEDKFDFFFPEDIQLNDAVSMFKGQNYRSAMLRDRENSCSLNPYDQIIEIKGNKAFQSLCEEVWRETNN